MKNPELPKHPLGICNEKKFLEHGTGRSGCNDAFSVFGFLAFLLALLDLILELQVGQILNIVIRLRQCLL